MKDDRLHWWKGWFIEADGDFNAANCFLAFSASVIVGLPASLFLMFALVWELHHERQWAQGATAAACCVVILSLAIGARFLLGRLVRLRKSAG